MRLILTPPSMIPDRPREEAAVQVAEAIVHVTEQTFTIVWTVLRFIVVVVVVLGQRLLTVLLQPRVRAIVWDGGEWIIGSMTALWQRLRLPNGSSQYIFVILRVLIY